MTIEEDYRSVVHALPVGVMEIDCNGRIIFASPAAQEIFAIQDEQSLTGSRFLDWIHPDDQSKAVEHMRWTLQTPEAPVPTEYRLLTCIDSESNHTTINRKAVLWGEVTFVSLKGPSATPGHLIVMARNITESKELETCLQQNLERQEFLNHLLQLLYRPRDLSMAMEQVLGLIGIHTHARHVYMFENRRDGQFGEIVLEWYGEGAQPRSDDVRVISYSQVPTLRKYLDSRGVACISVAQTLTPDLAALLYSWNVRTFVAIPVYGKDRLYGFIAYDDMEITKTWDLEEQDLLRSISRAVSSAISRKQVDEDEREHRILLEVLSDISSVLNSTLSFKDVLNFILSNLERVIPHQAANIALVDERRILTVADARGYPTELMPKILRFSLPIDRFKTFQRISQTNQPLLISDTQVERNWTVLQDMDWVRSYIGVAVRAKGKLLGILSVDSPIPGFFTREHIQRVQAFADHAAVAIENARLFQEAQRRADQMTTLYDIGLTLTQGLEMEQVLASLHTQCQQVLPCDAFYVAMYDEKSGMIQHPLFYGDGMYYKIEPRYLKEQPGLSGYVIESRKTVYIPDVLSPDVADTYSVIWITDEDHRTRSYVGVPLVARDHVIGVISMQNDQADTYTPEQIRLFETIANQAAITIENARIFNEMKQMAITDSRTGTFTRWHFSTLGQIEIERAQRYGHDMALLMMDIDRFKYFNDTYGHNVGDQLIEAVAKVCQKGLRSSDIIGRYGGDEFAIILPETDLEGALKTAERIRALVETIEVKSEERSTRVTISLGLVMREQDQLSLDELLICADRALYAAKQAGRNRVEVYLGCGSSIAPAVTLVSGNGKTG